VSRLPSGLFGEEDHGMADSQTSTEIATQHSSLAKRIRLPRLSGKASAAWLVICFVLTAVLIPIALRLPQWVEFEIVLAVWWAIWLAVLARLLYTGQRVADDHQMREPRNWFASNKTQQGERKKNQGSAWWDGLSGPWFWLDGDGSNRSAGCYYFYCTS
jgi:hypothetical protein